jgi:hypothetical protein
MPGITFDILPVGRGDCLWIEPNVALMAHTVSTPAGAERLLTLQTGRPQVRRRLQAGLGVCAAEGRMEPVRGGRP